MTGLRRFPIIAIAALLAAGCGANPAPPSSPPSSASVIATSTPRPTASPVPSRAWPTIRPIPTPAAGCVALDDLDLNGVKVELSSVYPNGDGGFGGFSIGHAGGELQVTRIEELSGQRRTVVPPTRQVTEGRGQMLGGREFVTFPSMSFEGSGETQAMVEARVTLALENASPVDLPTRFVPGNRLFDQVAVSVPDVVGLGIVTLDFVWADDCFRYEATGTIPVEVVPLARTEGCELDVELYWDELKALLRRSILVGGTTPRVGAPFTESKFAPYVGLGIDAFIGYMFDADAPEVSLTSGDTMRVENRKPQQLDLARKLNVTIWTRRSVVRAVTDYPPSGLVEVSRGRFERQPDGSYELPVPAEPGRYVVALSVEFDSACSTGTLWSVVNIATI